MGTAMDDAGRTAFEASETIRLPRRRVWDLLTDFTAAPLWLSGVTEMHADGPLGPGTELDVHAGGRVRTFTVGDYIPERELVISAGDGDMHTTYSYLLEDSGDDTLLTLVVAVAVAPSIAAEAQGIRTALADAEAGQLEAFRRYAERAP
jgi:uncharacterized protein YndB with AHSA1/START domain